jgi:hypothetical protein
MTIDYGSIEGFLKPKIIEESNIANSDYDPTKKEQDAYYRVMKKYQATGITQTAEECIDFNGVEVFWRYIQRDLGSDYMLKGEITFKTR